jgi:hypothetical protein
MSLKEAVKDDIGRVFLDTDDFAEAINFDGLEIVAVVDTDARREDLVREDNSLASYPWDFRIFARAADFPRRPKVTDYVVINGKAEAPAIVARCDEEMGMYIIYLLGNSA